MAEESKKEPEDSTSSMDTGIMKTKKKGVLSTVWNALFRARGDDFEKRLQHISKEEATVLARIARRSRSWWRMTKHLIIFSILCEVIAVSYVIMTTRSVMLNWKTRAWRLLPMFLLPALFFTTYSTLRSLSRMRPPIWLTYMIFGHSLCILHWFARNCKKKLSVKAFGGNVFGLISAAETGDQKDHKTLENLRAERQAKITELKEKTNYYLTQQLIQRYDPDPAAKAAAATVLASKLGADSGFKVYLGDDVNPNAPAGKSNDVEVARSTGLRNRKQTLARSTSMDSGSLHHNLPEQAHSGVTGADPSEQHPLVVEHHPQQGSTSNDGGWIARLAALLVGEDPTQSYALICGNCHMHNGLAKKEDFPYVTYYCPHCQALNRPKQADGHVSGSDSPAMITSMPLLEDVAEDASSGPSTEDRVSSSSSNEASVPADADGISGS